MNIERKAMLILCLFPNADKGLRKKLRKLADSKEMNWQCVTVSRQLHDLLGSILRHEDTHYDQCVQQIGKEKARFYVQGLIKNRIQFIKG